MNNISRRRISSSASLAYGRNKAGYTATLVVCGWARVVLEKVTRASGQEPYAQKAKKRRQSYKYPGGTTMRPHAAWLVKNDAILHQSCEVMQ